MQLSLTQRKIAGLIEHLQNPPLSSFVWTGNKGNKRTGDIGNSFHGGSDWAQRFSEGGTGDPTRSRSFVIREM